MSLTVKALKLIRDAEGMNQPSKWPGGASGITIGFGYDLGYVTVDQFESDWGDCLGLNAREGLKAVVGFRGIKAKNHASTLTKCRISREAADKVLRERTIPRYELLA